MTTRGEGYTFVCPECNERLAVNGAMREELIARGCVLCGSPVSTGAFTRH